MSSMPTESRIRSSGTCRVEPATLACVISPGCSINDSTPPSDSPRVNSLVRWTDLERLLLPADDGERHHPAEPEHLTGGDVVARVAGQPRVVDPADPAGASQQVGDRLGVVAVPLHPDRQRLQPAQRQPGSRTGRATAPIDLRVEGEGLGQLVVVGDQRPTDDVGVPADVLGGRMQHHVGAQGQRLLQVRRGKRVVHQQLAPRIRARSRPARRCRRCPAAGWSASRTRSVWSRAGPPRGPRPGRRAAPSSTSNPMARRSCRSAGRCRRRRRRG